MFMWTFVHDYSLVCVHIYKALVSAHRRQSWTLQPIAHSTAEYEWTVGVLHRSSQPRGQVGADIQATLSQAISLISGLSSSQRKGLLFTYMYSFKWFEFCARHSLAVCKYYGTQLWLRFILQVMRTLRHWEVKYLVLGRLAVVSELCVSTVRLFTLSTVIWLLFLSNLSFWSLICAKMPQRLLVVLIAYLKAELKGIWQDMLKTPYYIPL